jgi:hypothetical protein
MILYVRLLLLWLASGLAAPHRLFVGVYYSDITGSTRPAGLTCPVALRLLTASSVLVMHLLYRQLFKIIKTFCVSACQWYPTIVSYIFVDIISFVRKSATQLPMRQTLFMTLPLHSFELPD